MSERKVNEIKCFKSKELREWVAVATPVGESGSFHETGDLPYLAIRKLKRQLQNEGIEVPGEVELKEMPEHKRKAFDNALAAGIKGSERFTKRV